MTPILPLPADAIDDSCDITEKSRVNDVGVRVTLPLGGVVVPPVVGGAPPEELLPQPSYVDADVLGLGLVAGTPDATQQVGVAQQLASIDGQLAKQRELGRRQMDVDTVSGDALSRQVDPDVADGDGGFLVFLG